MHGVDRGKNWIKVYLSVYLIRAIIEEIAEKGVSWVIAPLFYMFTGVLLSLILEPANPVVIGYLYFCTYLTSEIKEFPEKRTEFTYFLSEIFLTILRIPSLVGAYLYIYAGAMAGYDYNRAFAILKRNRQRKSSENYGLPVASVAGLLGIQISTTLIKSDGNILQRVVGDPLYQLEITDIEDTMNIVLFSEVSFLAIGDLIITAIYLINTFIIRRL